MLSSSASLFRRSVQRKPLPFAGFRFIQAIGISDVSSFARLCSPLLLYSCLRITFGVRFMVATRAGSCVRIVDRIRANLGLSAECGPGYHTVSSGCGRSPSPDSEQVNEAGKCLILSLGSSSSQHFLLIMRGWAVSEPSLCHGIRSGLAQVLSDASAVHSQLLIGENCTL
ncbi:uncharacterized protein LAESUDRAFT_723617 [Laetiporus sulphureus 93-53]|uniref:Uncharacterized protein n=1 Tax=Laetiporus sulphureus 93-53 TaxID=1314785 RepID=A0A165FBC3_9APHY|nr:uncharacterized protein LAESUDRAFT_723617 [Laetiporus sulphureus 93-53]KZT08708.1 hypothetical protein LAESUDRAFT_723617 [Laetiporus sulphureus 93-53]